MKSTPRWMKSAVRTAAEMTVVLPYQRGARTAPPAPAPRKSASA